VTDVEVARYALRTFDLHPNFYRDWAARPSHLDYCLGPLGRRGLEADIAWRDGTCTAQCLRSLYGIGRWEAAKGKTFLPAPPGHKPPHLACTCGIYGALDHTSLHRQYSYEMGNILAVIAAEGRTIIGTRGLRTEYARVVAWKGDGVYATIAKGQFKDAEQFDTTEELLKAYHLPRVGPKGSGFGGGPRWWA
jgi:hypothetical protein